MKPTFCEKNEKLISMNDEEICEISIALKARIEFVKENIEDCKNSPNLVEYWEKRLEAVQSVSKSFHQKVFPYLEVV